MRDAGAVAPSLLDPILALVERIDRRLRRIRPVRPGALLGLEPGRHRGAEVVLADGTLVRPGDRVTMIHFDNAALRRVAARDWQTRGLRAAQADMRLIAARHVALPERERPVAYTGVTILAAFSRRAGFEAHPRPQTAWVRLQDWYLRSLLARWAGRDRLARGRRPLRTRVVWLSASELLRRYMSPPPE